MRINDLEFDTVFRVTDEGTVTDGPSGVYAPTVTNDPDGDVTVDGTGWTAWTGYTGQWSYNGAVMHPSEFVGGRLERDVLATPGVYAVVAVEDDDPDADGPIGWAVVTLDPGTSDADVLREIGLGDDADTVDDALGGWF
jgi:hypothetical protein